MPSFLLSDLMWCTRIYCFICYQQCMSFVLLKPPWAQLLNSHVTIFVICLSCDGMELIFCLVWFMGERI
uniref:Uncharacterized protein n=1 Tax=Aegilops tauschii subsp. strangulata TaxID=200361 RepID=A0A453MGM4_AEGTS